MLLVGSVAGMDSRGHYETPIIRDTGYMLRIANISTPPLLHSRPPLLGKGRLAHRAVPGGGSSYRCVCRIRRKVAIAGGGVRPAKVMTA